MLLTVRDLPSFSFSHVLLPPHFLAFLRLIGEMLGYPQFSNSFLWQGESSQLRAAYHGCSGGMLLLGFSVRLWIAIVKLELTTSINFG